MLTPVTSRRAGGHLCSLGGSSKTLGTMVGRLRRGALMLTPVTAGPPYTAEHRGSAARNPVAYAQGLHKALRQGAALALVRQCQVPCACVAYRVETPTYFAR